MLNILLWLEAAAEAQLAERAVVRAVIVLQH
jgi:hypothetical protein